MYGLLLRSSFVASIGLAVCIGRADQRSSPPVGGEPDAATLAKLPNSQVASRITPPTPPNKGILFVDHSKSNRSGHLGHALVEYEPGKILAFYPNCSDYMGGHSAVGWMEFKRSNDGGKTWGSSQRLPFSRWLFDAKMGRTAMAEKAVATDRGEIILFYLICQISNNGYWEPYWTPLFCRSADGGETWSKPQPVCPTRGRVFSAVWKDGEIRALHFANDGSARAKEGGALEGRFYELYVRSDSGKTFRKRSTLPFKSKNRCYGTLGFLADGVMIAYVYKTTDEYTLGYATSDDGGRTWSKVQTARFARKIRNPQFIAFDGKYYMHGRSRSLGVGNGNMILYASTDGVNWDNGVHLRMKETGLGAYSNSIIVHDKARNRLLIQASHAYNEHRTNVLHWWVDSCPAQQSMP